MARQVVYDFARSVYNPNASQPMLVPVIVCFNGRVKGMGTWCQIFGGMNRVLTAHHLFKKSLGKGRWTAHPVVQPERELMLGRPSIVRKPSMIDAVVCEVLAESNQNSFEGDWTGGDTKASIRRSFRLREKKVVRSILSGERVELTYSVLRTDGEINLCSEWTSQLGKGESGTGFIDEVGNLYLYLAGGDNRSCFSIEMIFPHKRIPARRSE